MKINQLYSWIAFKQFRCGYASLIWKGHEYSNWLATIRCYCNMNFLIDFYYHNILENWIDVKKELMLLSIQILTNEIINNMY